MRSTPESKTDEHRSSFVAAARLARGLWRCAGGARLERGHPRGREVGHRGRVGLGQNRLGLVHPAFVARCPGQRLGHARWPRTQHPERARDARRARRRRGHDFPRAHDGAQPAVRRGRTNRRGAAPEKRHEPRTGARRCGGAVGQHRHRRGRAPCRGLPAPTQRWPTPARHDRHGAGQRAAPVVGRRTHHGLGREPAPAGARVVGRRAARTRHGLGDHHARPAFGAALRRSCVGDGARPRGRAGAGGRCVRLAATPLHPAVAGQPPRARRRAGRPSPVWRAGVASRGFGRVLPGAAPRLAWLVWARLGRGRARRVAERGAGPHAGRDGRVRFGQNHPGLGHAGFVAPHRGLAFGRHGLGHGPAQRR